MKAITTATLTAAMLFAGSSAAMAARNFSDMTNDQLAVLKSKMVSESDENREAFRKEWQKRVAAMTPEEREKFAKLSGGGQSRDSGSTDNEGCQ